MNGQGTWQFMSANLVEDASAVHTFQDDLESSFWLLLWAALMYTHSSLLIKQRSKFIRVGRRDEAERSSLTDHTQIPWFPR